MLEQLSNQVRECLDHAADAKAKADTTHDAALKAELLRMQEHWLVLARSYGFTESLRDFTTANSEQARQFDERLRVSPSNQFPPPASIAESSDDWLDDALQLREIGASLIAQDNLDFLYNRFVDAAMRLMSSDMASMQLLDPERNQLRLVAWKGFHAMTLQRYWPIRHFC